MSDWREHRLPIGPVLVRVGGKLHLSVREDEGPSTEEDQRFADAVRAVCDRERDRQ